MVIRSPAKKSNQQRDHPPVNDHHQQRGSDADDDFKRQKRFEILQCLRNPNVNLCHLRSLCLSKGGLIGSDLRQQSWTKLLGIDTSTFIRTGMNTVSATGGVLEECHHDDDDDDDDDDADTDHQAPVHVLPCADLISIDVNRAVYFRYKTTNTNTKDGEKKEEACPTSTAGEKLQALIASAMRNLDPQDFSYYQGFHDVSSVLLFNIPNIQLASSILIQVARIFLRDAMMKDFSNISSLLDISFYPLLRTIDSDLYHRLSDQGLQPTIVLPWIITLFSHDIHDSNVSSRLFDAIFASHPLFPLYLSIAVLTHETNRQVLFDPECADPMMLHVAVKRLISNIVDDFGQTDEDGQVTIQSIIDNALKYM